MAGRDFTALRLDEVLPLFELERDERRGDGRLPRALPARPRRSALVDRDAAARVHPRCARPPHPSRRDQRARLRPRRRSAGRRVLRRRGRLDRRTSAPASRSRKQVGEPPCAANPDCGWWCSPSTASSSGGTPPRRPTSAPIAVCNQAAEFVNAPRCRRGALRRPAQAPARLDDAAARATLLARVLPALRGAVSDRALEGAARSTSRRRRRVRRLGRRPGADRSAPPARTTSSTPRAAAVGPVRSRRRRTRRSLPSRGSPSRERLPRRLPRATSNGTPARRRCPADPDAACVADRDRRAGRGRADGRSAPASPATSTAARSR